MTLWSRIRAIFNKEYRYIDTKNQVYNGKHYDYRSQQFFVQARELQERNSMTQTEAVDTIKAIYQIKAIVRKERDKRNQKDVEKIEFILQNFANDDLESGIEVVNDFGTP